MEELKEFLDHWADGTNKDEAKLQEIYSKYLQKDIEDCPKCKARAINDLRKYYHKTFEQATKEDYPDRKYILKPGNHQFLPGDKIFNNDNGNDDTFEWYSKNYPHTKELFDKIPK